MNDLMFYSLIIALLYYFLLYLPKQKPASAIAKPTTLSQSIQTEPILNYSNAQPEPNTELEPALQSLLANLKDLNQQL